MSPERRQSSIHGDAGFASTDAGQMLSQTL